MALNGTKTERRMEAFQFWVDNNYPGYSEIAKKFGVSLGTINAYSQKDRWSDKKELFLGDKGRIVNQGNLDSEIDKMKAESWQKLKKMLYSSNAGDELNAISLILTYSQPKPVQSSHKPPEAASNILEGLEKRLNQS